MGAEARESKSTVKALLWGIAFVACLLASSSRAEANLVFGGSGQEAGQLDQPTGIAANEATGEVFVADDGNNRISVFNSAGEFLRAFGWGVVNGSATLQVCTTVCRGGIQGGGAGAISGASTIAVDNDPTSPTHEDLFVTETTNGRVQRFTSAGEFVLMIGPGVDKSTGGEICTKASGDLCGPGDVVVPISPDLPFGPYRKIILATLGSGGSIFVAERIPIRLNDHLDPLDDVKVRQYSSTGIVLKEVELLHEKVTTASSIAVAPEGTIYLSTIVEGAGPDPAVLQFSETGTQLATYEDGGSNLLLSADRSLFSSGGAGLGLTGPVVTQRSADGAILRKFGYDVDPGATDSLRFGGIAVLETSQGDVLGTLPAEDKVFYLDYPSAGPVAPIGCKAKTLGNTKAVLQGFVNPEGEATEYQFQYVRASDPAEFEGPGVETTPLAGPTPSDFNLEAVESPVSVAPETTYRCRVVAKNASGDAVSLGGTFTTLPPFEVAGTWAKAVGSDSANLAAEVNPFEIKASGFFEVVDDAHFQQDAFADAVKVPDVDAGEAPIDFGSGNQPVVRTDTISGLTPNTLYHYRVVATDSFFPEGKPGPERLLRTSAALGEVPDGRRYELVSPAQKNNADVAIPGNSGGLDDQSFPRVQAASLDGSKVTYTSFTSFGEPVGAQGTSQYLSARTDKGWVTANITPPGFVKETLRPSFKAFSPDLRFAGIVTTEPPLTSDALEGFENVYLRDDATGSIRALTTQYPAMDPEETNPFCPAFAASAAGGTKAFFAANGAFAGAREGRGYSLYEWSEAGGVSLVSILPNKKAAAPGSGTGFGSGGNGCAVSRKVMRHAISSDGSRVYWTFEPASGPKRLMLRENGKTTVQVDAPEGGLGAAGGGRFVAATADGAEALFTDPSALTPDAGPGSGLYLFDADASEGERLTDLAPGGGEVVGVLGASEDLHVVYFVSNAALGDKGEAGNCSGEVSSGSGACDLYVARRGQELERVARISGQDAFGWATNPFEQTARVSPDGRFLAFSSVRPLTGYDNTVEGAPGCVEGENGLGGAKPCPEAYIYDAATQSIVCASCARSGARPTGPVILPVWANVLEPPHNLADDGARLFFSTRSPLVSADNNGLADTYEFERAGSGSCTQASPFFIAESGGCIYLISSGRSEAPSYLIGASTDGRDVFFSTRQPLVGWDEDHKNDVYDFRVGGGFPEPPVTSPCGDLSTCRSLSPGSPPTGQAGTERTGPSGNAKPSATKHRCPKGKRSVKRHGKRSVKRHGKRSVKRHGRRVCVKRTAKKRSRKHHHHVRHHAGRGAKGGHGR